MEKNNQFKPTKQMSEANISTNQPSIVPLKLPSHRIVKVAKFSVQEDVTNMLSSNSNKTGDVKGSDDKKRKRSPFREDQDDGTDVQDVQTANDSGSTHSKDASSDSEVDHLIDYTVRSRYGDHRNQHVRSQSWEEEDKKSNQSSFMEEEDDCPNDQDEQTEYDNRPLAHHQLKRGQSSEEDVEKEQQENTEFTSSQEEQIEKELCIEYSMEAIIDSEDEALGCCFDYSHRLSDKD